MYLLLLKYQTITDTCQLNWFWLFLENLIHITPTLLGCFNLTPSPYCHSPISLIHSGIIFTNCWMPANHVACHQQEKWPSCKENNSIRVTLAACGLEEPFFKLCCCVSVFWFWREIGFGVTYLLRVQYSCGVVLVFWFWREIVFGFAYVLCWVL